MSDRNYILIKKETYQKYKSLKVLRFVSSEKIAFFRMWTHRLLVYMDSIDNDIYDYDELLTDIKLTIEELYSCSVAYSDMINNYLKYTN